MIDPDKARGKKEIVDTCPYGAIWWNEAEQVAQKWNFDAHLLDRGETRLRCEQVCPTNVFRSLKVEDSEMERIVEEEQLQTLHPEYKARPRVYYRNLDRFTGSFIGGTLVAETDGTTDCATNIEVVLIKDGKPIRTTVSDEYGDFKFQGLEAHSGAYTVQFNSAEHGDYETSADLGESVYLGILKLYGGSD